MNRCDVCLGLHPTESHREFYDDSSAERLAFLEGWDLAHGQRPADPSLRAAFERGRKEALCSTSKP